MKSNCNKDMRRKVGVRPACKPFRNINERKSREIDNSHRLIVNTRNRIYKSSKSMSKQPSTEDILGKDVDTFKKWIGNQFTPEMNRSNIDHVRPISSFDVSNNDELKEAFKWKNTQPLLK